MLERIEKLVFALTRLSTLTAIGASWFGALLMFGLGLSKTYSAFATIAFAPPAAIGELPRDETTVVHLIGALDRFLIAVVLIYFGYGLYGLFVRPSSLPSDLGLPDWLHVDRIGELKQTVAEVIIVILFVLFLRVALETFHTEATDLSLETIGRLLLLPVSILLLAAALRLAELHPKRDQTARKERRSPPPDSSSDG
ncbi:MAG: YqhA family protein [Pseudomonadota bacterium]